MAIIKSGATEDCLVIDPTSKAFRSTLYNSTPRETSWGPQSIFSVCSQPQSGQTNPIDLMVIQGSPTKVVRVLSCTVTMGDNASLPLLSPSYQLFLAKRTSPDYQTVGGGAGISYVPGVALDSLYGPTALVFVSSTQVVGTLQGLMSTRNVSALPIPPNGWVIGGLALCPGNGENWTEMIPSSRYNITEQEITLRGPNEMLCVFCNAVTMPTAMTGATWINILWSESTL